MSHAVGKSTPVARGNLEKTKNNVHVVGDENNHFTVLFTIYNFTIYNLQFKINLQISICKNSSSDTLQ